MHARIHIYVYDKKNRKWLERNQLREFFVGDVFGNTRIYATN